MDRVEKALAHIDRQGTGLEIGPSHSPIAPKQRGFKVRILDYLDADGLREKFKNEPVDLTNIEEVDFVWRGEPLADLVGHDCYDWIIASNVLEHTPDLVSFLVQCEAALKPCGVLSLIIPDKRNCYDYFRPISTTGDVLDAFTERRNRSTPGCVFDNVANAVTRNGVITWIAEDKGELALLRGFEEAVEKWEHASQSEDYMDAHNWCFVPESFRLIMDDLRELELTTLGVVQQYPTSGFEFHVALSPGAERGRSIDRLSLLRRVDEGAGGEPVLARSDLDPGLAEPPLPAASDPPVSEVSEPPVFEVSEKERRLILRKRRFLEVVRRTRPRRHR